MKRMSLPALLLLLAPIVLEAQLDNASPWPGGEKAAICLTYDDALPGHLDNAIPQLNKYGFKGSFYCTGSSACLAMRMEEWRLAAEQGHELGNHSLFHPCDGSSAGWVKKEYDLQYYSKEQLLKELRTANTLLLAIDGRYHRTYGYTCSHSSAGGESFVEDVRELFLAARSDGPIPESLIEMDIHLAPSWCVKDPSLDDLIAYAEEARAKGTIATVMFHGVGDSYLNVEPEVHEAFLKYLADNREDYYVATFKETMEQVQKWQSEHPLE